MVKEVEVAAKNVSVRWKGERNSAQKVLLLACMLGVLLLCTEGQLQ